MKSKSYNLQQKTRGESMGAFIFIKKPRDTGIEEIEKKYHDSLNVFNKMGLRLNRKIVSDEFVIHVFHKYNFDADNILQLGNNQFIIATGTLIYKRKTGREALQDLFADFSEDGKFLADILGQFCLIVAKDGKLYLLNDYTGLYHVHSNDSRSIISNSFLAILKALDQSSVSTQGLYEYLVNGAYFGDATPIKEITLLSSKKIWQLFPDVSEIPRASPARKFDKTGSPDEIAPGIATDLIDYFDIIKKNFGDNICSALSGGVHTRLLLGLMKRVGIKPDYLYVYGDENNVAGRDANVIQIVRSMAEGEGISVDYINKDNFPRFTEDDYKESLEKRFFLGDGFGHEIGLFDNGSDLYYRLSRTEKSRLQLNGGGGEVFRNYWKLPDRSYTVRSFLQARYERSDYSIFTDRFDYDSYVSALQEKIKASLGTDKNRLDRVQIELLQPEFDNKYWMGSNNSINNLLSYSLTPLADAIFQYRGCYIPLKYKNYFTLESALMKIIDPDLARYPTSHGVDLFNNRLTPRAKLQYYATLNMPLWLRAYMRKHFWYQKKEVFKLGGNRDELPFYLTRKYLDKVFKVDNLHISEYVYPERITDPEVLSRVLTAELVITNSF